MDAAEKREHLAAVAALPGRDRRSWRGAFARRGVMKGGRLCGEGDNEPAGSLSAGISDCNDKERSQSTL